MSAATVSTAPSVDARVRGLDGLRAIAAIAVLLHHVGFASAATNNGFWGNYLGRLDIGVPVFFALSGFLLFGPIASAVLDDRPLRPALEHLWRRAWRIYPAFWVALTLIILLTSEAFVDVTGAVTTYLLIHIHWPTHSIGPMPQSWSLATEVSFYLALPVMARFLRPWLRPLDRAGRRNGLLLFVAGCYLLSVFFRIWVLSLDTRWTGSQTLWLAGTLDYFAIGMALAVAKVGFASDHPVRERLDRVAGPAGIWWVGAALLFHIVSQRMGLALGVETASWPREMGRQFIYGAIGFCLLFPLVFGTARASLLRRFVGSGPMEWLGLISYSIYLWHMAFINHPWEPLADLLGATREAPPGLWDYVGTGFWTYLAIAAIPTFVVSIISYYVVEQFGLAMQGGLRRPRLDPTPMETWVSRTRQRFTAVSYRAQLGLIALAGLALRVVYVITAKHDQTLASLDIFPGDQFYYSRAADALAEGEGFVTPWQDILVQVGAVGPAAAPVHAADHPPLTALVAAPASLLPGGRGDHLFEQRFLMTLVGAAVIVAVGLLARQLAGRAVGVTAALIAALYPGFWINDGLVMAESLTTLFVASFLLAALRYRRTPSVRVAAVIGVLLALAALARAESLLLAVLVVIPLVWSTRHVFHERVRDLVVAGAATVLVLAPWVGPNLVRFEEPVTMSTNDGLTLVGANNDATYGGGALGFWRPPDEYFALDQGRFAEGDASVDSRIMRDDAIDYITDNTGDLPKVVAARIGRLFSVYRPLQMADLNTGEGRERWASHLAIAGYLVAIPLALIGWWRAGRDGLMRWPFAAILLHVTLIAALFYGIPRFRVPAEIGLVVLAAIGVRWLASLGSCRPPRTSSSPASSS